MTGGLTPPRGARVAWLLVRVLAIRLKHRLLAISRRRTAKRTGTARKANEGAVTASLTGLLMLVAFGNLAVQVLGALRRATESLPDPGFAFDVTFDGPLAQALTLEASVFLGLALLMTLGAKELAQAEWDLEWLASLPVPIPTLLATRAIGRAIVNPSGVLTLGLLAGVVAFREGAGPWSPAVAIALALPLLLLVGAVHGVIEAALRLRLEPARIRNAQALVSISASVVSFLGMSPAFGSGGLARLAQGTPVWVGYTPPGLFVATLGAPSLAQALPRYGLLCAESLACALVALWALGRLVAGGLVATSGRETARGVRVSASAGPGDRFGPVARRELRLLGRDRNFLVQTTVLPVVIVGMQAYFGTMASGGFGSDGAKVATTAFVVAAYALMFSAFQTLNAEGQALWLLYTVPRPLDWVLARKARLWAAVALVYPVGVFAVGAATGLVPSWELLAQALLVLLGIPVYAAISASLGVFGSDPLATEVQKRVRVDFMYLYMLLASMYGFAIYVSSPWQRIGAVVLVVLLALALWQKARDRLPYLLDPTTAPPARVSLSDGLIAALAFFVVQAAVLLLRGGVQVKPSAADVTLAFAIAGAVTWGLARYFFWRQKAAGVPRMFGPGLLQGALRGAALGTLAAGLALAWSTLLARVPELFDLPATTSDFLDSPWFGLLAVVAAPISEEFIFRGLVFGGLRRTLGVLPSVLASAGIFAVVHPAASVVPVFGLGVAAAIAYESTGLLAAPMVAHAVYNALVLWGQ